MKRTYSVWILILAMALSCKTPVKQQEDKIYSRHLQEHIPLEIITTPMPDDKSRMNLLLINGNLVDSYDIRNVLDSLWKEKLLQPLTIVSVTSDNFEDPDYYSNEKRSVAFGNFVVRELLPFTRKKVVIRKFNTVAIYGEGDKGYEGMKIAWQHQDKISLAGISQKSTDTTYAYTTMSDISRSRKKPSLNVYFSSASSKDNRKMIQLLSSKNLKFQADSLLLSDQQRFAAFLLYAFGQ